MLAEDGNLRLIDNEWALTNRGPSCVADSIFVPGTQKFAIVRFGSAAVMKEEGREDDVLAATTPAVLFDYRCAHMGGGARAGGWRRQRRVERGARGERTRGERLWPGGRARRRRAAAHRRRLFFCARRCDVPGGEMSTAFPPATQACLARIAAQPAEALRAEYTLATAPMAEFLRKRAADLLARGVEWVTRHGEPANPPGRRYLHTPPCCRLAFRGGYRCDAPADWRDRLNSSMPLGSPVSGHKWVKPYADPGTFVGGTVF
jgi:hypothetical protein